MERTDILDRLRALGLELPDVPTPAGTYRPAKVAGGLVFTAGQTARIGGVRRYVGKVGQSIGDDDAYRSARDAALNCIACAAWAAGGLERLGSVVKVTGFVNCTADYDRQPAVVNGASDLFEKVFGEAGAHARSAVGVSSLPSNASVEIEVVFELRQ